MISDYKVYKYKVFTELQVQFTNWICQVRPYKSLYFHHGPYNLKDKSKVRGDFWHDFH